MDQLIPVDQLILMDQLIPMDQLISNGSIDSGGSIDSEGSIDSDGSIDSNGSTDSNGSIDSDGSIDSGRFFVCHWSSSFCCSFSLMVSVTRQIPFSQLYSIQTIHQLFYLSPCIDDDGSRPGELCYPYIPSSFSSSSRCLLFGQLVKHSDK